MLRGKRQALRVSWLASLPQSRSLVYRLAWERAIFWLLHLDHHNLNGLLA